MEACKLVLSKKKTLKRKRGRDITSGRKFKRGERMLKRTYSVYKKKKLLTPVCKSVAKTATERGQGYLMVGVCNCKGNIGQNVIRPANGGGRQKKKGMAAAGWGDLGSKKQQRLIYQLNHLYVISASWKGVPPS